MQSWTLLLLEFRLQAAFGPTPRVKGYYLVVTHSGVTLSPFLAKAVADEIVHGRTRPELESFRPSRFFN